MSTTNVVYIAQSLDGYIADKNDGLDWLNSIPNPDNDDFGFVEFMNSIDALVMGRRTYEVVCGFGGDWPYAKPVFVLTNSSITIPENLEGKVSSIGGTLQDVCASLAEKGCQRLYIDGGKTIQSFLAEGLIDELTITTMPVLLGGGISLFGELAQLQQWEHVNTEVLLKAMVKTKYRKS